MKESLLRTVALDTTLKLDVLPPSLWLLRFGSSCNALDCRICTVLESYLYTSKPDLHDKPPEKTWIDSGI